MNVEVDRSMESKPFVVAAIPAFNKEKTIAKVVLLARRHVNRVVVCDDGSTDMTAEIAEPLGVDVVRHERNSGSSGVSLPEKLSRSVLKELEKLETL